MKHRATRQARPFLWAVFGCLVVQGALPAEYRSYDGAGNHITDMRRGAAGTPFIRFGYATNYGDLIGDQFPSDLPNPREVSRRLNVQTAPRSSAYRLTDWTVQWGQFLTHDLSLAPHGGNGDLLSNGSVGDFRIPIHDPQDPLGPRPLPFGRSDYDAGTGTAGPPLIPREQINVQTAYIDGSQIYGVTAQRAAALRTFSGGRLKSSTAALLPFNEAGLPNDDPFGMGAALFLTGDPRTNEQLGLIATHTVFMREHNRLADLIQQHDPGRSDEEIFQLARKIVGAEVQAITYREYLPAILGPYAPLAGDYSYDPTVDGSITNSFAAAFFRFGHSAQSPALLLMDPAGQVVEQLSLRDAFFRPSYLVEQPQRVDWILRGLAAQLAQEHDLQIVEELQNHLFGPAGSGGTDLAALDIQRGRDHGLPGYNSMRNSYGLPMQLFDWISSDAHIVDGLRELYRSPNHIDPWIGMLAEDHLAGSTLGPLGTAVVANQFERLRDGDRFFYTGDAELLSLAVREIVDLENLTLADVLRWNTELDSLPRNVFIAVPEPAACALLLVSAVLVVGSYRRFHG